MAEVQKQLSELPSVPQTAQNWNFDPTPLLLQIADQQFKSGNYHAAVKLYGDVLKRDPKNAAAKKGLQRAQEALQKAGRVTR
jgi:thioredoxin-like negative regulator of GroEL